MIHLSRKKILLTIILVLILGGLTVWANQNGYISYGESKPEISEPEEIVFTRELFEILKDKYWNNIEDKELANLFLLASEKVLETDLTLTTEDLPGVIEMVNQNILNKENKNDLLAQIGDVVMANLAPFGRSRLFTQKQTQSLINTVVNKDETSNLYSILGLKESSSIEDINKAYNEKIKTAQTEEEKAQLERAKSTLSQENTKSAYDKEKIEATVIGKKLTNDIFYIYIKQFSPATLEEFVKIADSTNKDSYTTLILDLRDNIGGAIDILPYFLGPFIGPDRYAYDFYRKGESIPYKTKTGWLESLVKFKKVSILINENAQSSAEVMAATLKKYNVGVLIGNKTKGWGTVEQIIPLETKLGDNEYTAIIVQSLTVSDDGKEIEGRGVEPHIYVSNPNWIQELSKYYSDQSLIREIQKLFK